MSNLGEGPSNAPGEAKIPVRGTDRPGSILPLHAHPSNEAAVGPLLHLHQPVLPEEEVPERVPGQPVAERPALGDAIPRRRLEVRRTEEPRHGPEKRRAGDPNVLDGVPAGEAAADQGYRHAGIA